VLFGERFFDEIRGRTVIDFGCGTGGEAVEMAERGASRVIGVDIRDSWLVTAREHADAHGVSDRCTFMTSPDRRGDVIVSLDSFEHFDDPAAILRIMDGYLAPGGRVIATFGPTSVILLPETRMIWLVRMRPASGSSNRPARMAVIAGAGWAAAAALSSAAAIVRTSRFMVVRPLWTPCRPPRGSID